MNPQLINFESKVIESQACKYFFFFLFDANVVFSLNFIIRVHQNATTL